LTNGDYVVRSSYWDNGAIINGGAISYGNGSGGTIGAITADNSVRGTSSSGINSRNGQAMNSSFDTVNNQLVVGRPFDNIVTLFRTTPTSGNVCTPFTTVSEGDLFPGGFVSFGVSQGPGSVIVDHVNAGTGLQSFTIVGVPTNAVVNIPAYTPGTYAPVTATFTAINPALPVDYILRAASTFHAANIRVRCEPPPQTPIIESASLEQ